MTKPTVSAAGGAMPRTQLSRTNLIDEATGEVNLWVLKGLARKEALATYGAITPRSLRSGLKMFAGMVPTLQDAWRDRHGLPVQSSTVTSYAKPCSGVRRAAF